MIRLLRSPLELCICVILVILTLTVFSQVIARYIFQAPLSWSEELARFLLMWLSMLSAAYAFKVKSHFALKILKYSENKSDASNRCAQVEPGERQNVFDETV